MVDWSDLWSKVFELWQWAWNWSVPIAGLYIQPVPLCLGIFIVEFILDICFPTPSDWTGGNNGGDN